MDFFDFKSNLSEARATRAFDPALGKKIDELNMWWMENAIDMGFINPQQKPNARRNKSGQIIDVDYVWTLFPIMYKPYDRIVKGGICVIGENPGLDKAENNERIKTTKKLMKQGKFPAIRGKNNTWYDFKVQDYVPSGKSAYDTKVWKSTKTREKGLVEFGAFPFHAKFLTMIKGLGLLETFLPRIMHTNMIPFNSTRATFSNKKVVEKKSEEWLETYIKVAQPSIIITSSKVFDSMKKMGLKEVDSLGGLNVPINFSPDSGSAAKGVYQGGSFYKTGLFRGVPVVRFVHWSGAQSGGPSSPTFQNPWKRELFKMDIKRLMSGRAKEVTAITGKVVEKVYKKLVVHLEDEYDLTPRQIDNFFKKLAPEDLMEILEMVVGRNLSIEDTIEHFIHLVPDQDVEVGETPKDERPVETPKPKAKAKAKVKPAKQPAVSKPSKATFDPRFDAFEKLNADRIPKGSKDYKQFNKDAKSMTYDDLLAKWAVPGKLKRP